MELIDKNGAIITEEMIQKHIELEEYRETYHFSNCTFWWCDCPNCEGLDTLAGRIYNSR